MFEVRGLGWCDWGGGMTGGCGCFSGFGDVRGFACGAERNESWKSRSANDGCGARGGGRLVSLELMARAARLLAPTAVAEDTQEGNELQRNRGDRHEHAFDAFRRVFQICFFFVDQRGLLRGAVDAPVFFEIEMARVAGAAVSLLVPALRAGIDQRVMAMGAEVRRFGIGVLAFGADAGCKRWFGADRCDRVHLFSRVF